MGKFGTAALRIVMGLVLAGSVFIQLWMVPLAATDLSDVPDQYLYLRICLLSYVLLALLVVQVCAVCVWKLATRVRRGTVFNPAAFKFVNVIIAALCVGSLATFVLGAVMAPGEAVAPGLVLLVGGLGVLLAGIVLIVWVLRQLLVQATMTDAEAARLRDELGKVI